LIRPDGPWHDVEHVETVNWVGWFNNERIRESVDVTTPRAAEGSHHAARDRLKPTAG
jgi:putative transposase